MQQQAPVVPDSAPRIPELPDNSIEIEARRPVGMIDAPAIYGYDIAAGLLGVLFFNRA